MSWFNAQLANPKFVKEYKKVSEFEDSIIFSQHAGSDYIEVRKIRPTNSILYWNYCCFVYANGDVDESIPAKFITSNAEEVIKWINSQMTKGEPND